MADDAPLRAVRGAPPRWVLASALVLTGLVLAWSGRHYVLAGAGRLLVSEELPAPVDVIFVSGGGVGVACALEAGRLYHEGIAREIVLATWRADPEDEVLRSLGMIRLPPSEYMSYLMERAGVPKTAVRILPEVVNGTDAEVAAVAAFAQGRQPTGLMYVIERSHTRRARWMLHGRLPAETRLVLRSPRTDDFAPDAWWHDRDQSREVVMEYLRWINALILRDPWSRRSD